MDQNTPFIDANIFLRFLVFDQKNPHLSQKAKYIIKQIQDGKIKVQIHILTVAEIIFVLEHFYEVGKAEIREKLEPLLALEHVINPEKAVIFETLRLYSDLNVDFADCYTYAVMNKVGVKEIYTFDTTHFKRFTDVKIW